MSKRIASLALAMLLFFTGSFAVNAAIAADNIAQPLLDYTSSATVNMSISNGTVYGTARLIGYNTTDKIKITMTIQKKTLLWWSEVDTWTTTYYDSYATMSKSCSVGSGTYRVKAEFTAYCGSDSETITAYSGEESV